MRHKPFLIAAFLLMTFEQIPICQPKRGIEIVPNESARRVDIFIDGRSFASYTWAEQLKTPVLNPLRTINGTIVTRGFPLAARPGERVDHPHHVGMWFNYGDVNGVDFWNNSTAIPPERQKTMGTVVHREVTTAKGGTDFGVLTVASDWVMPDGQVILREETTFSFQVQPKTVTIHRATVLTAQKDRVVLGDNKEGLFGIRVRRELEQPANEPLIFTDASGTPSTVKVLDNKGVSGLYHSSEGKTGDDVWGSRGKWTMLRGKVDKEDVTVAILDHPQNPGFPTYWHARGYGLFAANPLGQAVFSNGKEKLNLTLEPGQSVSFRYLVLIISARATPEQIEAHWRSFAN